jgi:hypothetical protein
MPTIRIPTSNPKFGRFVPVGVNGAVRRIPVGVDFDATDAEMGALAAAGVPTSIGSLPAGTIMLPTSLGSRIPIGLNGVVSYLPTGIPFAATPEQLVALDRKGISYWSATVVPAQTFPTPADFLLVGNRLAYPVETTPAAQFVGGFMTYQAPPWDTVGWRFGFVGFAGQNNIGETNLGNDVPYEAALIEINDVKYYLPATPGQATTSPNPFVVPNGGFYWTADHNIVVPANTIVRIGWADAAPTTATINRVTAITQVGPELFATASGRGDYSTGGSTSRLSLVASNTTAASTSPGLGLLGNKFIGAPAKVVARPLTIADAAKAKAFLGVGMSIDWGGNHKNAVYGSDGVHSMAYGGFGYGLADPTNGRIPFATFAVPGTRALDITNNPGAAPGVGASGWAKREAFFAAVGFPWTHVIMGAPINDITAFPSATVTANLDAALAAIKARGGRKTILTPARPQTNAAEDPGATANGYLYTGGDTHQTRSADSVHVAVDAYIMAKPVNVDFVLDIRPAHESSTGSRKYKQGQSTTLAQAAAGPPANVVGSIAAGSNVLTVESVGSGTLAVDQRVTVAGLPTNTFINALGTGTGGTGTYTLSANATAAVSSATLTVTGVYRITVSDGSRIAPGDFIAINPNISASLSEGAIVTTKAGNVLTLTGGLTKAQASGATVTVQWVADGTHLSTAGAKAEAAIVDAAKPAMTV